MTRRIARSTRVLSILAMAAAGALLNAQTVPSTQPSTVPATVPSTRPATAPSATQPGAASATTQPVTVLGTTTKPAKKIVLEFRDVPIDNVLDYLSEVAGFIVVKQGPVDGKVNITSRGPVSAAEALTLLNAALKPSGYTAIQSGRILRVGKRGDLVHDTPVFSGADPEAVPETDDLVTWVIPVKNVDAAKLRTDLLPIVSGGADFTANQGSNSLILTDTTANIHRIVSIVAKLDQQQSLASEILIKPLKFANAASAAKLILTIFAPDQNAAQQQGGPGGGGGRGGRFLAMLAGQGGGGAPGGANSAQDTGKVAGKVTAAADDRTNTIVVVAPTGTLTLIKSVLDSLDEDPTPGSEVKVFPLSFADAASAAKLIKDIFAQEQSSGGGNQGGGFGGFGGFGGGRLQSLQGLKPEDRNVKVNAAAADRTNTLVVTAPPDTLKLISQILTALDSDPAAMSQVKVFPLEYADSASAAKLLMTVFQGDGTPQQSSNPGVPQRMNSIQGIESSLHGGHVTAVSDDRTNMVVVTAPIEAMKIATGILEKLDSNPSSESALFIYHLRNGVAADIQATLSTLFGAGGIGGTTTGVARNTEQTGGTTTGGTTGGTGGLGSSSAGRGSSSGFGASGSSGGFGSPLTSNSSQQRSAGQASTSGAAAGANIHATSELVGQVIVVADSDTNSLIVSTARKYREQVQKIIMELDRPVPQVLIKVLIAEVTRDRTNDFGADFSILDTRASGNGLTVGQNNGNIQAGMATPAGLVASMVETNVSATLHALAVDNKLDVLSRPYILASDNQPASITIGQEVPFITNTQITETGQQINTITYQAVGIILNVTPHINPDGAVTLDVAPQISDISSQTVPIGNGITAPVIDNRSAQSRVTIRNGNTIVIGGMYQDQKTSTLTKIPLLGDIPYLGTIFTRTQTDRSRTELLIFLTPHLAQQPEGLKGMTKEELKGTIDTPNAVEKGVFDAQMRGMKLGHTGPTTSTSQPTITEIQATPSTKPFKGFIIGPDPTTRMSPSSSPEPGK